MPKSANDSSSTTLAKLKRLVPRLKGQRIAVVGDLMLDRYLWGTASRLSPEAPVPIVEFAEQSECLGGAGNVAANLAALGARVEVFSAIGSEKDGAEKGSDAAVALRKSLAGANISDKGVLAISKRVTTVKTRIIARHQHIVRVDHERREPLDADSEGKLLRALSTALKNLDGLVLSDYDKGLITD